MNSFCFKHYVFIFMYFRKHTCISCISEGIFVFPAPLPSNTYLPLTFSTSLSPLLMNWEMVGEKQCKILGISGSVSLFPRMLAIQIPLWEFYFSVYFLRV